MVKVRRALEMHAAVGQRAREADIVIMAAAVADYMPEGGGEAGKIEKTDGPLRLTLVRTPDILAELGAARNGGSRPVLVGFAAESGDPVARGRAKLARKAVDLIVANDVSQKEAGFDSDLNAATLISPDGEVVFPTGPKTALASLILDRAEQLLARVPR
jgi:phosphopantothenoylcysteine decarboxylase/phosphopantothenate--cysteine ligase